MFSIEMHPGNPDKDFISKWTFINDNDKVTLNFKSSTFSIITASIPRSELHEGTWNVYVTVKDRNNGNTPITNSNSMEYGIPVFSFICD